MPRGLDLAAQRRIVDDTHRAGISDFQVLALVHRAGHARVLLLDQHGDGARALPTAWAQPGASLADALDQFCSEMRRWLWSPITSWQARQLSRLTGLAHDTAWVRLRSATHPEEASAFGSRFTVRPHKRSGHIAQSAEAGGARKVIAAGRDGRAFSAGTCRRDHLDAVQGGPQAAVRPWGAPAPRHR